MINWKAKEVNGVTFLVSECGDISSTDRYVTRKDTGKKTLRKGRLLKFQDNGYGYLCCRTTVGGERLTIRPHRWVAELFVENPDNLPQVNHIDGNKKNNVASNLEWVDNSGNQIHAVAEGLIDHHKGRKARKLHFTTFAIDVKCNEIVAMFSGNDEMAEKGFDYRLVSAVCLGKRKSHRGCTFHRINHKEEKNYD